MEGLDSGEDRLQEQRAERDLSLALLELAADALELIVVVWQLDDDLVCFSRHWAQRLHGVEKITYLDSMEVRALIHPNDHLELDTAIAECLDGNSTIVNTRFRVRTRAGWLPLRARCRATTFDEGGRVTRIVALLTEEKERDVIRLT